MNFERTGFETPIVGTASYKAFVDANGYLITSDSKPTAGYKRISFNNIKADATDPGIGNIAFAFLEMLPGLQAGTSTHDDSETTMTVKWEAE